MTVKKEILCAISDCGCELVDCECWRRDSLGVWAYDGGGADAPSWSVVDDWRLTFEWGVYEQSIEVEDAEDLPRCAAAMRIAAAALENALDKETP